MWIGDTIYYDSDRDGHFNLYGYDVKGGKTTQLTINKIYDVRWPSTDRQSRIVYELNGELQIFDVKIAQEHADLDHGPRRRPRRAARRA